MSAARRARLLNNLALKEQARLPQFSQRQNVLRTEIAEMEELIERIQQLLDEASVQKVQHAQKLQTNRWYELRLIEEMQTLQNKLDFLRVEMTNISAQIIQMGHKQKVVSGKAKDALRDLRDEREAMADLANSSHQKAVPR
jgi:chromosome segregation ATPase